jgi:hypothetical protein
MSAINVEKWQQTLERARQRVRDRTCRWLEQTYEERDGEEAPLLSMDSLREMETTPITVPGLHYRHPVWMDDDNNTIAELLGRHPDALMDNRNGGWMRVYFLEKVKAVEATPAFAALAEKRVKMPTEIKEPTAMPVMERYQGSYTVDCKLADLVFASRLCRLHATPGYICEPSSDHLKGMGDFEANGCWLDTIRDDTGYRRAASLAF